MFDRPRCRDWTPLATQQLRLRNLIQISGHNIVTSGSGESDEKCSIYYTLHMTSMSSPFYTSCKVETPQNVALWPEINIQNHLELGSKSVCIRVWQHHEISFNSCDDATENGCRIVADNNGISHSNTNADKLLFLWGVYFSGLVQISNRTTIKLEENTLVFQMHGGLFTSSNYLKGNGGGSGGDELSTSPSSNALLSSSPTSSYQLPNSKAIIQTQNCDDKFVGNNSRLMRNNSTGSIEASSHGGGSASSPTKKSEISAAVTQISQQQQLMVTQVLTQTSNPKIRYIFKEFLNAEIRPSYDLKKLLALQELQRWHKNKSADANELMEKICMKSAFCLNLELIATKSMYYRQYQLQKHKPSGLGRTLDRLLYQQNEPPDPDTLLRAQKIRRDIEIAKFRCRLLVQERDNIKVTIRHLEARLASTSDSNIEMESWVMSHYRCLGRERDIAVQERLMYAGKKEVLANMKISLQLRRYQLLRELNEIYVIERLREGERKFMINGIYLPDAESYSEFISSTDLSVALGYVTHVVILSSIILNVPIRNQIIYKGSRSEIIDNIKMLPPNHRIFPLFSKETPPADDFLYGVFLLNQNIAQIKFTLGIHKGDMRATLTNLQEILNVSILNPTRRSEVLSRDPGRPLSSPSNNETLVGNNGAGGSVSNSSMDGLDCIVIPFSQQTIGSVEKSNSKTHRICRSVGSYTDAVTTSENRFSSEPFLSST